MFHFIVLSLNIIICSSNLLTPNNETAKTDLTSVSVQSQSQTTNALLTSTTLSLNPLSINSSQSQSTTESFNTEGYDKTTTYTTIESNNNTKNYFYNQNINYNSKQALNESISESETTPNPDFPQLSSTSSQLLTTLDPNLLISSVISNTDLSKSLNQSLETGENRRTNANPSVDDIISGILQLIGGNVKLSRPPINKLGPLGPFRPEPPNSGTRINNRGPPKAPFINPIAHPMANVVPPSVLIGPGRPAGIALPFPPSHLARLPIPLNIVPTKPPFVIPESDVSFLLGLIKPHIKDDKELNALKNLPKFQTSLMSDKIRDKTSLSAINSRPIFTDKLLANPSKIHELIRTNSYYSNIFSSLSSHLLEVNATKPILLTTTETQTQMHSQNDSEVSEAIASSFVIPSQPETPVPTGPVTDWVPLLSPTSVVSHEPTLEEPLIITMPEEPSVFEMIVKQQIGPKPTTSSALIDPTPVVTKVSINSTVISSETTNSMSSTITPSKTTVPFNSMEVSTNLVQNTTKEDPEIVYGRPAPVEIHKPIAPSFTTNTEEILTLIGSGDMSTNSQYISTSTRNSIIAVGRPVVVPVEMDEVKPQVANSRPNHNRHSNSADKQISVNAKAPTLQVGSGVIVSGDDSNDKKGILQPNGMTSQTKPLIVRRPPFRPRPNHPIVRIDTCIVGDDSTCDLALNEKCLTELGLSSCQCRPGFSRNQARSPCVSVISLALSLKVDRIGDKKLLFNRNLMNSESEDYQYLEYESLQAINSVFSSSKLTKVYLGTKVNKFYSVAGKTIVNASINLELNNATSSPSIKRYVQQELSRVIAIRNNNIGDSQLWVEGSLNAIPRVEDLNECSNSELNDCSKNGKCINEFGSFRCECELGYEDKYANDKLKSGRFCSTCSPQYCSNRGECFVVNGQRECKCKANFIGSKCDIDAEVLGVALGGSVAALIIIIITFLCLYMWNQRWKKEQQKMEAMSAASGHTFSYVNKQAATAYRLTIDDRMRWAQIAEAMASNPTYSSNYYVNPDQISSQHHLNHVYATPNRVSSSGTLLNDDLCSYESRQYSRSLRPKSRNTSGNIGYSSKNVGNVGNDSIYNETEFSTREMIYSPTHLIPAPRSQFSYS